MNLNNFMLTRLHEDGFDVVLVVIWVVNMIFKFFFYTCDGRWHCSVSQFGVTI